MATKTTRKKRESGGPYLSAAVFADKILKDENGAMSVIRIIDRMTLTIPADAPAIVPSKEAQIPTEIEGLIAFKTGYSKKKHALALRMFSPSGIQREIHSQSLEFGAEIHGGFSLRFKAHIPVSEDGLYWLDVLLDGKEVTRMPLLINVVRAAVDSSPKPSKKIAKVQKKPSKSKAR